MGLLFQHLCSRLSVVTGRNMALENRLEYPANLRLLIWVSVELASIAADLGYVMGTATALSILFGLQLHWGVLLTGLDTFIALGLQSFGIRKVTPRRRPRRPRRRAAAGSGAAPRTGRPGRRH